MEEMRYNMRLAFLAYPPSLVAVFSESLSISFETQKTMLMECLDISEEDILIDRCSLNRTRSLSNLMNKAHEPAFYLAVDHKRKTIVLSIRGTSSIGDIITDFNNGEPRKYQTNGITGYIHEGMFHGAQFVHKSATNTLINVCLQYGEYQVVITGHSMGAGAAAVLGLMYNDNKVIRGEDGKRLKVWCFASPCVATREFTDQQVGNDYITSITLEIDMVCRLGMESVKKWNMRQDLISAYSTETLQQFLQSDDKTSSDASDGAVFSTILKTLKARNPEELFFPLGKILWFVPPIVMHDDVALRRRTLMKMLDEKVDGNHGQIQLQQSKMENFVHHTNDRIKHHSGDHISDHIDNQIDDKFGNEDDPVEDQEDSCENEEEQKVDLFTIRKRPMYQSSDEEDDEEEFDAIPLSETVKTDTTESSGSTNQTALESTYVLCDATKCRDLFQEFVHEYPSSLTTHMVSSYMKACGSTLKNEN